MKRETPRSAEHLNDAQATQTIPRGANISPVLRGRLYCLRIPIMYYRKVRRQNLQKKTMSVMG